MSDDLPIPHQEGRSEDVVTVQWGADEPARRPGTVRRFLPNLSRDPRIPPLVAGLGALATFAAMASDWIVTTLPNNGSDGGPASLPSGLSELGNLGGGYLAGTLALLGCLALVLFGTAPVRHNARMVGLALSVGTGGVLLAITLTMDNGSRTLFIEPDAGVEITPGRGLVLAYAGTAAYAVALLLTAPFAVSVRADPAGTPERAGAGPATGALPGWPWRRARTEQPEPDEGLPPPADLTVAPAPPFTRPPVPFARPEPPATDADRPDRWDWRGRTGRA